MKVIKFMEFHDRITKINKNKKKLIQITEDPLKQEINN